MSVASLTWFLFFTIFLVGFTIAPRGLGRAIVITIFNFVFYYILAPRVALLVFASVPLVYGLSRFLMRREKASSGFLFVVVGSMIAAIVAIKSPALHEFLGLDRWFDVRPSGSGFSIVTTLAIPLGLTYYLIQTIGFLLESSWGSKEARSLSFWDFAATSTLFLNRIAGPIARLGELREALHVEKSIDRAGAVRAFRSIAVGLCKISISTYVFDQLVATGGLSGFSTGRAGWPEALAVGSYVFADFSGYTDVVRGYAALVGFELPDNFARPFFARNVAEYWRRWHVSLGAWLRDYFAIPVALLIKRRVDSVQLAFVLTTFGSIVVMTLWHEVSGKYLFMGLANGVLVVSAHLWKWKNGFKIPTVLAVIGTFYVSAILRLVLLPGSFDEFIAAVRTLHGVGTDAMSAGTREVWTSCLATYGFLFFLDSAKDGYLARHRLWSVATFIIVVLLALIGFVGGGSSAPSSYSNF